MRDAKLILVLDRRQASIAKMALDGFRRAFIAERQRVPEGLEAQLEALRTFTSANACHSVTSTVVVGDNGEEGQRYVTARQVADIMGLTERTMYRRLAGGNISKIQQGRRTLYRLGDILDMMEEH